MKKTYILNPLAKEFIPRAFRNQIMGAPVIAGHHPHTSGLRSSPVSTQSLSRSALSASPTVTSQTASGHPVGAGPPLRFSGHHHSGMVRSASPMQVIDPYTGQRMLYVPVMPMPMRVPMYHHPAVPFVDHHGVPHYPQHGIAGHPYGLGPPVRHSPPHPGSPLGTLSPSQLSPQPVDRGAQSKEHTPVKQRQGSPLVRNDQKSREGISSKAGVPIIGPMHGGHHMSGHSPGSSAHQHKGNNLHHSPDVGRGSTHGQGEAPQALARLEEMRIQEEYTYLLRTRGLEFAKNYLSSVRRAQSTQANSHHPSHDGVNQMEQLLQKLKLNHSHQQQLQQNHDQQQQSRHHAPAQNQHNAPGAQNQGSRQSHEGLLMQQRGVNHNQAFQEENPTAQQHHHHNARVGSGGPSRHPTQDQWRSNSVHSADNNSLHVEVNHFSAASRNNSSNYLQHPSRGDYDQSSPRGSSEPPTPPFVRDLAAHDFGANDPSPRTPANHSNLPPEAFQFPDQYRGEFNSRTGEVSAIRDQLSRLALQIPGRTENSSSSEHSRRIANASTGMNRQAHDVFGNNLGPLSETAFPSLRNANPSNDGTSQEWSMMNNSMDIDMAAVAAGDFRRRFSSPHNYSPALQAQNSENHQHHQQQQQQQQNHQQQQQNHQQQQQNHQQQQQQNHQQQQQNHQQQQQNHQQQEYHHQHNSNFQQPSSPVVFPPNSDTQQVPPSAPIVEESKQPATMSYANVLRAPPKPKLIKPQDERVKTASPDPFSLISDLGNRQNKDGYYSYFN